MNRKLTLMIGKIFSSLFVLVFLLSILPVSVFAQDEKLVVDEEKPIVDTSFTPTEIISMRTENSKTTEITPGKYSCDSTIGAIHYKDDYSDNNEQWKDIDLTPTIAKDGTISVNKTPYELTIKGLEILVKDKKTGATTSLTLTDVGEGLSNSKVSTPSLKTGVGMTIASNIATDTDLEISWTNSKIRYTRILKTSLAPITAKYSITETGTNKICC